MTCYHTVEHFFNCLKRVSDEDYIGMLRGTGFIVNPGHYRDCPESSTIRRPRAPNVYFNHLYCNRIIAGGREGAVITPRVRANEARLANEFNNCYFDQVRNVYQSPHFSFHGTQVIPCINLQFGNSDREQRTVRLLPILPIIPCPTHSGYGNYRFNRVIEPAQRGYRQRLNPELKFALRYLVASIERSIWSRCRVCIPFPDEHRRARSAPPSIGSRGISGPSPTGSIGGGRNGKKIEKNPGYDSSIDVKDNLYSNLIPIVESEEHKTVSNYEWVRVTINGLTFDAVHLNGSYFDLTSLEEFDLPIESVQKVNFYHPKKRKIMRLEQSLVISSIEELKADILRNKSGVIELISTENYLQMPLSEVNDKQLANLKSEQDSIILIHFFHG